MPSTTALTWPTVDKLAAIADYMGKANSDVHGQIEVLQAALRPLVDLDVAPSIIHGVEPLTLETLGALTSALAKLRFDLEYALGEVRTIELQRDAMALEAGR